MYNSIFTNVISAQLIFISKARGSSRSSPERSNFISSFYTKLTLVIDALRLKATDTHHYSSRANLLFPDCFLILFLIRPIC